MRSADRRYVVQRLEQRWAWTEVVERPDADQAFQRAFSYMSQVYPMSKIVNVGKGTFSTSCQDCIYWSLPDVLHCAQPKANSGRVIRAIFDGEIPSAGVDVGWFNVDAHAPAVRHIQGNLVGVVLVNRQQSSHVLDWEMHFEVRCLYRDHAVICCVPFGESVAGESLPIVEDLVSNILRDVVLFSTRDEFLPVLQQYIRLLLGYTLSQCVRLRRGVPRQVHSSVHDLFLVHGDAVRLLKDGFQHFVTICDRLIPVHAFDIAGNKLHRSGSEKRHHGNDVIQCLGLHLHQVTAHAGTLYLENTGGFTTPHQLICLWVICRDVA